MKCPKCFRVSLPVLETRRGPKSIYRWRECKRCGHRFVTEELVTEIVQLPRFDKRVGAHR